MKAILVLENGETLYGENFGASGTSSGEICFNTSMTGYQEIITDPSYRGQIVAMTQPHIGNYGINEEDSENQVPQVRGFIVTEAEKNPSNWRSQMSLPEFLAKHNTIGIENIDTRKLTKMLRVDGSMRGVISTELSEKQALEMARKIPPMSGADFVKETTTPKTYTYTRQNQDISKSNKKNKNPNKHIVAYDFGVKQNILRMLGKTGVSLSVVPANTSAEDVLAMNPDGIFLSNGPGDPASLNYIHQEVQKLIGKKPIYAICLGHQIICHALGGKTFKLKFGHRGGNQPVKNLADGKVLITAQNHGFAVDPDSLGNDVEITQINLNDNTAEALKHRTHKIISVQYHPEAAPGPNDAKFYFQEFINSLD